ncbi:hypothetical protein N692_04745 [Lactiplantibacillus plantarum EGD-AQ4]|nr:hypothetical protein N692_04745 [Lactiplantibacillus plantarum EGD-AQ4]
MTTKKLVRTLMISTALLGAGVVGTTAVSSFVQPQVAQAATMPSGNTYKNPNDGVTYYKVGNHWYNNKNAEDSQELAEVAGRNFINYQIVDNETGAVLKTFTNFSMTQTQITDLSDIDGEVDGYIITDYVDQDVTGDGQTIIVKASKTDSGSDNTGDTGSDNGSDTNTGSDNGSDTNTGSDNGSNGSNTGSDSGSNGSQTGTDNVDDKSDGETQTPSNPQEPQDPSKPAEGGNTSEGDNGNGSTGSTSSKDKDTNTGKKDDTQNDLYKAIDALPATGATANQLEDILTGSKFLPDDLSGNDGTYLLRDGKAKVVADGKHDVTVVFTYNGKTKKITVSHATWDAVTQWQINHANDSSSNGTDNGSDTGDGIDDLVDGNTNNDSNTDSNTDSDKDTGSDFTDNGNADNLADGLKDKVLTENDVNTASSANGDTGSVKDLSDTDANQGSDTNTDGTKADDSKKNSDDLPQTDEKNNGILSTIGAVLLSVLGIFGIRKRF